MWPKKSRTDTSHCQTLIHTKLFRVNLAMCKNRRYGLISKIDEDNYSQWYQYICPNYANFVLIYGFFYLLEVKYILLITHHLYTGVVFQFKSNYHGNGDNDIKYIPFKWNVWFNELVFNFTFVNIYFRTYNCGSHQNQKQRGWGVGCRGEIIRPYFIT